MRKLYYCFNLFIESLVRFSFAAKRKADLHICVAYYGEDYGAMKYFALAKYEMKFK